MASASGSESRIAVLSDLSLLMLDVAETQRPDDPYHTLVFYSGLEFLQKLRRAVAFPRRITLYWAQEGSEV